MNLIFHQQKMFLANVNVRAEVHGEEREPAGDLKLECDIPNDVLTELHPALKGMLYYFDDARPADLVEQSKKGEPGFLPHLRIPDLVGPLKWGEEMTGVRLTLHQGKSELVLLDCKVNNVQFEPKDGGTIALQLRVQAHPGEKDWGRLCSLTQSEVTVSITTPE